MFLLKISLKMVRKAIFFLQGSAFQRPRIRQNYLTHPPWRFQVMFFWSVLLCGFFLVPATPWVRIIPLRFGQCINSRRCPPPVLSSTRRRGGQFLERYFPPFLGPWYARINSVIGLCFSFYASVCEGSRLDEFVFFFQSRYAGFRHGVVV